MGDTKLAFLKALFSENRGFIEFRILKTVNKKTSLLKQLFCETLSDVISDEILDNLTQENEKGHDICFGILPRESRSDSKDNIKFITTLWTHISDEKYKGDEAVQRLCAFREKPSAIVAHSKGYDAYWFLQQAVSNEDNLLIRGLLKGIGRNLGVDSNPDLSELMRLPETWIWKGENCRSGCAIIGELFEPGRRYTLNDFIDFYVNPDTETTHGMAGDS